MQQPVHPYYLHIEQNLQALWDNQMMFKKQIEDQLHELEVENKQLKEKLDQIKPITIENINYKIQELTVQQLSGTLNIGMSALTDAEEIKKWLNPDEIPEEIPDHEEAPTNINPSANLKPM